MVKIVGTMRNNAPLFGTSHAFGLAVNGFLQWQRKAQWMLPDERCQRNDSSADFRQLPQKRIRTDGRPH
jgi:hypothetical protein